MKDNKLEVGEEVIRYLSNGEIKRINNKYYYNPTTYYFATSERLEEYANSPKRRK